MVILCIQMQNKIDTLQAELQQAKSAGHNHSFADAERLTEVLTAPEFPMEI